MVYAIQYLIEILKATRMAKKLSQRDLAAKIDVPQSHISKIESGTVNPRLSSVIEMARNLDLEVMLVPRQKVSLVKTIIQAKPFEEPRSAYIPDQGEDND